MHTKYQISIIVPVYNVEKYVEKCVKSLLNQTFKNYEIILIDDGSTDSSYEIIKKIEEDNDNVSVITQKNQGQGKARSEGIKQAKGEYLTFVDSDDWVSEDYLEKLYNSLKDNNADISVCNVAWVMEKSNEIISFKAFNFSTLTSEEAINELLLDKSVNSYTWGKLYKKDIFIRNKVDFPPRMLYEDLAVIIQTFYYANKITFINDNCYYYLQSEKSSTRTPNINCIFHRLKALKLVKDFLVRNNEFDKYKKIYTHFCLFHLYLMQKQIYFWNFKKHEKQVIHNVMEYIEEECITKDMLRKTFLTKQQKLEILTFNKNKALYRLVTIYYNLKSRVSNKIDI
ncbi:glycosyltransferase family 2 protein [Clostridium beijerinckii]|uniref:Glycosyltransferase involved in cell wall biosynthesis n=1 Tax=Clostridium beijerinckii TaxID=1520 RepID=A0AAE5LS19_CLOBE|nr:glycosyltransferase family 2 protein [Clostridium beijerinckii]NSB16579.1 glycosyltransferase involved in cell wall biosynthesis [Clostridium beijerinckii]OOM26678.1 putative glycosyltransferase EpsH [Clostridium beijerinckii]